MAGQKINGPALASVFAGIVFLWAGIKGYSVLQALQAVVQGKDPRKTGKVNQISGAAGQVPVTGTGPGGSSSSSSAGSAVGAGTLYTHSQLAQLWISNGGDPAQANNAACHGIQESGGNPAVTSSNPDGGTNVGLWQLDTPGGKGAGYTIAQLQDPVTNVRITIMATRNGQDWSAWATPGC